MRARNFQWINTRQCQWWKRWHTHQKKQQKTKSTFEMRSSHHYHKVAVNVNWCLFFALFSCCFPTSSLSLILIYCGVHLLRTFADEVASPILHFVTCSCILIYTGTVGCACPACWVPSKDSQENKIVHRNRRDDHHWVWDPTQIHLKSGRAVRIEWMCPVQILRD